jgi:hypothetical protein
MTDIPRSNWRCGNCGHYIEGGEPSPKPFNWNCSNGNPTPEKASRGPCMQWCPKALTDNDY